MKKLDFVKRLDTSIIRTLSEEEKVRLTKFISLFIEIDQRIKRKDDRHN